LIWSETLLTWSGRRIENLRDLVLYRFGSTGVHQVLSRAAELLGLTPVFPVRNMSTFSSGDGRDGGVFRDCVLVKKYARSHVSLLNMN
jgi:ribosome-binding ATPase YchF (GTP1/OBG family)